MNPQRFDEMTRNLAKGLSKREVLKLLIAGAMGLIADHVFKVGDSHAHAIDRIGTDSVSSMDLANITCQSDNNVSLPCDQLNDYVANCGVICPDGSRLLGKGGCTSYLVNVPDNPTVNSFYENHGRQEWCDTTNVTWVWTFASPPDSTTINYAPSNKTCCQQVCSNEVADVLSQLAAHEQGHRDIINSAFAKVNTDWNQRTFQACGKTKKEALTNLRTTIQSAQVTSKNEFLATVELHPPEARSIDCSKCLSSPDNGCWECRDNRCQPKICKGCEVCENGQCRDNCPANYVCCHIKGTAPDNYQCTSNPAMMCG